MTNLKLISIFCIIFAVSVMIGCGKDNNKTSDNGEISQTTEVVPENIMKKFRRDIDKGGIGGGGGFGGEWGLSEYRKCIKGENGKIYGLATKSKNVELWTAIMEVDVENNRLRFLEIWYDKMTYSALHKLSDDKFDKSWQSSNDASNPVNRYCAYLKQHYDEIPALDKNKKYYSNDLEEAVDMVEETVNMVKEKEKNAASFDSTRNNNNLLDLINKVDRIHENTVALTEEIIAYQNKHATLKGSSDLYEKARKATIEISSLQKDVNNPSSGTYKITDPNIRNHFSRLLGYDIWMLVEYTEAMKQENGKYDTNGIRNIIDRYNECYSEFKIKN